MNILGITFGNHDTSAALIKNGKLVCACEEERFNKEKHTKKFPINSINECLRLGKLKIKDINYIALSTDPKRQIRKFWLEGAMNNDYQFNVLFDEFKTIKKWYNLEDLVKKKLGYTGEIKYYKHHLNHLASSFYPSNFKKSLVVSYDGVGEGETGYFAIGNNGKLNIIHDKNRFPNSLGLLYAAVTSYLGWRYACDEGIIMGLASYGKPHNKIPKKNKSYIQVFREIVSIENNLDLKINTDWITFHKERDTWLSEKFIKMFGKRRIYEDKLTQHHKNIASALQLRLEEIILSQLKFLKKKYRFKNLCLSGGVGLNCSMNGKIAKSKLFDNIFVQPASGDNGLSIGTAINCSLEIEPKRKLLFETNCYLGSRYSNQSIKKNINKYKNKVQIVKNEDYFDFASDVLIKKKIIGWFQGAAEFGPRALGNRSILASPNPSQIKDIINKNVKFRESFRPFAPAIMEEHCSKYFKINQKSEHMLIACDVKPNMKKYIPATVHVDNTARVQTVTNKSNNRFYNLLKAMYNKTNIPVVLNTSFNVKGQPIVNSPKDAILCFLKYNIDFLFIGDYILKKK
jgi:carbamoyltransferase